MAVSKNAGGDTATCNIGSLAARHSASGDTATCNIGSLAARHSYIGYKDCTNRCSFLKNISGLDQGGAFISQLFNSLDAKCKSQIVVSFVESHIFLEMKRSILKRVCWRESCIMSRKVPNVCFIYNRFTCILVWVPRANCDDHSSWQGVIFPKSLKADAQFPKTIPKMFSKDMISIFPKTIRTHWVPESIYLTQMWQCSIDVFPANMDASKSMVVGRLGFQSYIQGLNIHLPFQDTKSLIFCHTHKLNTAYRDPPDSSRFCL